MKLDDEQFQELTHALTKLAHGTMSTDGATGFEALVMALTGDGIDGRESLPRQVATSLDGVAAAIHDLADAYRERTRRLG